MRYPLYKFAILIVALVSLSFIAVPRVFPVGEHGTGTPVTISIDDLQRSIDFNALPVQEIKDLV